MVEIRRLRFRRNLLTCVLLVLINELRHDLTNSGRPSSRTERFTRVKLASAYEIHAAATGAQVSAIYQHATDDDHNALGKLVTTIRDALPVINLNYSILDAIESFDSSGELDDQIDNYYNGIYAANMSLDELQLMSVRAAARTAPTPIHSSWGYATRQQALLGSVPVVDNDLCSLQLNHLAKRLEQALKQSLAGNRQAVDLSTGISTPVDNFEARQVYKSGDLDIMRYLDTYGRVPSDFLSGNVRWYGSYSSCTRMRLRPNGGQTRQQDSIGESRLLDQTNAGQNRATIKFRYCMGAFRSNGWSSESMSDSMGIELEQRLYANPSNKTNKQTVHYGIGATDTNLNHYFIKIGLCLPEACDSSALERTDNLQSLERLLKFNLAKPFNSDHYKLTDLYCPPDSRSPLRSIPFAGKLLLVVASLWLTLIISATVVHLNVDKFYLKTVERIRRKQQQKEHRSSSPSTSLGPNETETKRNEFEESDIMNVKLNTIKLNIYIRDKSRQLVPGVDLVDCLSLYSNWLKYVKRVKFAIVEQHGRDKQLEDRRSQNEYLVARQNATLAEGQHLNECLPEVQTNSDRDCKFVEPSLERLSKQLGAGQPGQANEKLSSRQTPNERGSLATEVRVDTSSLNAFKVIALVWIIAGHCVFYSGSTIANGALLKDFLPTMPAFALANGALYITELFFIITGCLTAYLTFKRTTKLVDCDQQDRMELRGRSSPSGLSSSSSGASPTICLEANNANGDSEQPSNQEQQHAQVAVMERRLFDCAHLTMMVVNRYLRILPTYLLVYATVKLVTVYVGGEGQLWDYAVSENSMRRACVQESWWPVLTLTSNFVDIYKHCIVGGWYLAADMQFALMSAPLLLLLAYGQSAKTKACVGIVSDDPEQNQHQQRTNKIGSNTATKFVVALPAPGPTVASSTERSRQRTFVAQIQKRLFLVYGLIVGLGCLSALLSVVYLMLASRVNLAYIVKFSPHTMAMMSQNIMMYTNSIFRFRAFAAGLLLGHLLYCYEFKLIKLPKFIQQHGAKLAVVILSFGFCIMFMPIFLYRKIILSHDMTALLMVLSAGGIDIVLGLFIFLICIGKAPKAILFALNSPLWSLLSSLSLSAFLVHTEIIVVLTSQLDPPPSISFTLLLFVFSATLLLTYTLAFGLYLTFEMPISRLISSVMRNSRHRRNEIKREGPRIEITNRK